MFQSLSWGKDRLLPEKVDVRVETASRPPAHRHGVGKPTSCSDVSFPPRLPLGIDFCENGQHGRFAAILRPFYVVCNFNTATLFGRGCGRKLSEGRLEDLQALLTT